MKYALLGILSLALIPAAQAAEITISLSEDFQKDLTEEYGQKEGEYLTKSLTKDINQAFEGQMAGIGEISVVIEDAKPNRPTMKQLGDTPGLSMQSISLGGADLTGQVTDEAGNVIAMVEYDYYETDIRMVPGSATWSDANRAFDRFSRKLAKETIKVGTADGSVS